MKHKIEAIFAWLLGLYALYEAQKMVAPSLVDFGGLRAFAPAQSLEGMDLLLFLLKCLAGCLFILAAFKSWNGDIKK